VAGFDHDFGADADQEVDQEIADQDWDDDFGGNDLEMVEADLEADFDEQSAQAFASFEAAAADPENDQANDQWVDADELGQGSDQEILAGVEAAEFEPEAYSQDANSQTDEWVDAAEFEVEAIDENEFELVEEADLDEEDWDEAIDDPAIATAEFEAEIEAEEPAPEYDQWVDAEAEPNQAEELAALADQDWQVIESEPDFDPDLAEAAEFEAAGFTAAEFTDQAEYEQVETGLDESDLDEAELDELDESGQYDQPAGTPPPGLIPPVNLGADFGQEEEIDVADSIIEDFAIDFDDDYGAADIPGADQEWPLIGAPAEANFEQEYGSNLDEDADETIGRVFEPDAAAEKISPEMAAAYETTKIDYYQEGRSEQATSEAEDFDRYVDEIIDQVDQDQLGADLEAELEAEIAELEPDSQPAAEEAADAIAVPAPMPGMVAGSDLSDDLSTQGLVDHIMSVEDELSAPSPYADLAEDDLAEPDSSTAEADEIAAAFDDQNQQWPQVSDRSSGHDTDISIPSGLADEYGEDSDLLDAGDRDDDSIDQTPATLYEGNFQAEIARARAEADQKAAPSEPRRAGKSNQTPALPLPPLPDLSKHRRPAAKRNPPPSPPSLPNFGKNKPKPEQAADPSTGSTSEGLPPLPTFSNSDNNNAGKSGSKKPGDWYESTGAANTASSYQSTANLFESDDDIDWSGLLDLETEVPDDMFTAQGTANIKDAGNPFITNDQFPTQQRSQPQARPQARPGTPAQQGRVNPAAVQPNLAGNAKSEKPAKSRSMPSVDLGGIVGKAGKLIKGVAFLLIPIAVLYGVYSVPPVKRAVLLNVVKNASGQDFSEADLNGANLEKVNLSKTMLNQANLSGANLNGANLNGANLNGANLAKTTLDGAQLNDATLVWTNLQGASLKFANLSGADLTRANLEGADLGVANLKGAKLGDRNTESATKLESRYYLMWQIVNQPIEGRQLANQDLSRFNLSTANLRSSNLAGTNLSYSNLAQADLGGANLNNANLTAVNLNGANMSGANLGGANTQDLKTDAATTCPGGQKGPCQF
jgi:uncharacterized protein YjbI with pentapeptide repeats